jgi:hypothetical protein
VAGRDPRPTKKAPHYFQPISEIGGETCRKKHGPLDQGNHPGRRPHTFTAVLPANPKEHRKNVGYDPRGARRPQLVKMHRCERSSKFHYRPARELTRSLSRGHLPHFFPVSTRADHGIWLGPKGQSNWQDLSCSALHCRHAAVDSPKHSPHPNDLREGLPPNSGWGKGLSKHPRNPYSDDNESRFHLDFFLSRHEKNSNPYMHPRDMTIHQWMA